MPARFPKFRDDLIVSEGTQGASRQYLVKDPVSRRFFRLRETEYYLASRLDGTTDLDGVARNFEERFGVALPIDPLEAFVEKLGRLGLLAGEAPAASLDGREAPRGSGKWLYIKLKTINPDRLFAWLAPRIRFFFTKWFVLLTAALSLAAFIATAANLDEYEAQAWRLLDLGSIPLLVLSIALVVLLHESAHGLTCAAYGGHVTEMGFLLMYFMPAFYCNVSDAWLFPERAKRLWVSFAGVFFQIFLWAAATILWRAVDPETRFSDFLVLVMTVSGVTTLFSLNPLMKLDGYYLLVDWLEMPNLRAKAFAYLADRWRGVFRKVAGPGPAPPVRERRIYVWYGVAAGVYSAAILVFVVGKAAAWMLERFHGAGLLVLAAALILLFTGVLEKWTMRIRGALAPRKGERMPHRRLVSVLAVTAVVGLVLVLGRWELRISGKFVLLPGARATIRAEVDGVIAEVLGDEGDTVQAGALLVRIDDREYRSRRRETEAEIAKGRAELDLLRAGPLDIEVQRQEKLVEKARSTASFARNEHARVRELFEKNLASRNDYEKAEQQLTLANKDLEHAESDLRVLARGNRPEKIREAEAEVERLEAALDYLDLEISRTEIRSPFSGIVATHRLRDRLGEHLEVGDEICEVVSSSAMLLEMPVSEKDIVDVREGMPIRLKARALPARTFAGRVVSVPPVAVDRQSRTVLVVTAQVDDAEHVLKPGMTGTAKILCGKRRIVDLWTRKIVRFVRVEFWWW